MEQVFCGTNYYEADGIFAHPDFSIKTKNNDIAIIRVKFQADTDLLWIFAREIEAVDRY